MAKVTFGALVTEARNKLGGIVYSRNRHGAYSRIKITPPNPKTAAQIYTRATFKQASQHWTTGLSDAQRTAWIAFATAHGPTDGPFEKGDISGFQWFMRLNAARNWAFNLFIDNPPSDLSVPQPLTLILGIFGIAAAKMELSTDVNPPAGDWINFYLAKAVNAGHMSVARSFQWAGNYTHNDALPLNLYAAYVGFYGVPVAGTRIWVKTNGLNGTTGMVSYALTGSKIISA